jgi:AraC-like DNA-binding protein
MIAGTIANVSCRAIIDLCLSRGLPSDELLAAAGIAQGLIREPGGRISTDQVFSLWKAAAQETHDPLIAQDVARLLPFGAYSIGDYLLAAGPTPRLALTKLGRILPLLNTAFDVRMTTRGAESGLELHNHYESEAPSRMHVEFILALVQSRLRYVAGIDWRPREIWFTHPPPRQFADYDRAFQCRVRFNQPVNQMVVDTGFLDLSLPYADPLLSEMLEHHARRMLKQLTFEDHLLPDMRQAFRDGLTCGDFRLSTTAKKLALSSRSLQRELSSRGTSYREQLDRFRRDLALDILPTAPVHEIVAFLQFSESSAFYRAFRRWTGRTPHEYLDLLISKGPRPWTDSSP